MRIFKEDYEYGDSYDSELDPDLEFTEDDYDDFSPEVVEGKDFDYEGEEYTWYRPESDAYHMDFDNWQVWSAFHHMTETYGTDDEHDELSYFVVEIDTEFIDWGPVDSEEEAIEFLESKYDDYLNDEE